MEKLMRRTFLYLSQHQKIGNLAKERGLKLGAKKFVAGITITDAIEKTQELKKQGFRVTLDHVGEFISTKEEASEATKIAINTLRHLERFQIKANLSVKLTQLGLNLSPAVCEENVKRILDVAKETNAFVRIDMESYAENHKTLALFSKLYPTYAPHVGLVLQAYLFKSIDDVQTYKKNNVRICKGAYKENAAVAFQEKPEVDKQYMNMVMTHLKGGGFTAIATHDASIISELKAFIKKERISQDTYEFQMLYGIREDLQMQLKEEGYPVRIYVPFGRDWYGYFMRRLAERPANVLFVWKGVRPRWKKSR